MVAGCSTRVSASPRETAMVHSSPRMSLTEQSAFQLGYYHETQRRYTAKAKKEEQ